MAPDGGEPVGAALYAAYLNLATNIVCAEEEAAEQRDSPTGGMGAALANMGSWAQAMPMRDDVDVRMRFEDIEFEQTAGSGLLGAGAVGSVYRATYKVGGCVGCPGCGVQASGLEWVGM